MKAILSQTILSLRDLVTDPARVLNKVLACRLNFKYHLVTRLLTFRMIYLQTIFYYLFLRSLQNPVYLLTDTLLSDSLYFYQNNIVLFYYCISQGCVFWRSHERNISEPFLSSRPYQSFTGNKNNTMRRVIFDQLQVR